MEPYITIQNLTKKYQQHTILDNISFMVQSKDSIVITGHNGCGKSTLLKIMGKMTAYNKGTVICHSRLKFGYVPENFPKIELTAREYIQRLGRIEGDTKEYINQRLRQLAENFFMEDMLETPIKFLSKGSAQKIAVMQAIFKRPDVLLLDEPLSGQDLDSQRVFIKLVQKMNQEGTALVMACHEPLLIEAIADTKYEIKKGCLLKDKQYIRKVREYRVMVFCKLPQGLAETSDSTIEGLSLHLKKEGDYVTVEVTEENSNQVIRKMIADGYELRSMKNERI